MLLVRLEGLPGPAFRGLGLAEPQVLARDLGEEPGPARADRGVGVGADPSLPDFRSRLEPAFGDERTRVQFEDPGVVEVRLQVPDPGQGLSGLPEGEKIAYEFDFGREPVRGGEPRAGEQGGRSVVLDEREERRAHPGRRPPSLGGPREQQDRHDRNDERRREEKCVGDRIRHRFATC